VSSFQAPTGTRDILPPESARWSYLIGEFASLASRAGYGLLISPMFEDAGVFRRGVGEDSDVVMKQMYEFKDKGNRSLALRPEGTASVVRAFSQHHPQVPWKVWYATPAFRYERPQKGRYRQHHQLGAEALGSPDPDLDVEIIALLDGFLRHLGLQKIELRVNSMGDDECLPSYKEALSSFLRLRAHELCEEHQTRFQVNPLRVLDCKKPECLAVRNDAPRLADAWCEACSAHFARVLKGLDALNIQWRQDEYLVRGLDYYTRTTFEFSSHVLDAAQDAVGGGGRYNGLAAALGAPDTPGIGFGSGIERILAACDAEGVLGDVVCGPEVFVVDLTGGGFALGLTSELRRAGIRADRGFDNRSAKAQLRQADRSGARLAVIVGSSEAEKELVTLRELRGSEPHRQETFPRAAVVHHIREWLT
jgi:histidyl-tRNA synthetase